MKATDLMIGDWVQKLEVGGHYRKGQIKAIIDDNVDVATSDGEIHTLSVNGIEPIPLTAEILEKNGFDVMVFDNADKLFAYGSLCILEHKSLLTFKISDCRKRINYVHELQHALKLCGIDKNIEL